MPPLAAKSRAVCAVCEFTLEMHDGRSIVAAMACSLAAFLLLFPANIFPLVHLNLFTFHGQNTIAGGIELLWSRGWVLLAGLSAALALLFPFLRFGSLSAVLISLWFGYRPWWIGRVFRWSVWLDIWAMPDVFLLAAFIGYYRLINVNQLQVTPAIGGYCFVAAAFLTMLTRAVIDRRAVWRIIGQEPHVPPGEKVLSCVSCDLLQPLSMEGRPCPRCDATLLTRKTDALPRTVALLATAFVLFFPANILPMNTSQQLGSHVSYTIFHGVRSLFDAGLWPLGALIFCTSILIPMGKIMATSWCCWSVWSGSTRHLHLKTKLFRLAAELGRWSKTDPFVIVFYVPLMNFGGLATADANWGATAFMLMTFLTLLATDTFDPRLMWDIAYEKGAVQAAPGGNQ